MINKKLTQAHLLRHAPNNTGAGLEASIIDVAQDFLLTSLVELGVFDYIAIKGGTALRKFYAGNSGRFSTDLDFALTDPEISIEDAQGLLKNAIEKASNDYFRYKVDEYRGRPEITYESDFGGVSILSTKIDVGAPSWLKPTNKQWIKMPIHDTYGFELPNIKVVDIEENMSEKLARLNRRALARDMYDLLWIATNSPHSQFNKNFVRKLTVLKVWVDKYGIESQAQRWGRTINATSFSQIKWQTPFATESIQDEQIGLLTVPIPKLEQLSVEFCSHFKFLSDLTDFEKAIIDSENSSRRNVISEIQDFQLGTLGELNLW
jgi:predicted nucleotidyltransferase component of viral defense system